MHPLGKMRFYLLLSISILLCFCTTHASYADEATDENDANLSIYIGNPDYRIENGLAINKKMNAVENGREDLRTAIIPKGITEIASVAFTDCALLESVVVPEGVTKIGGGAFEGCEHLTSITLPTTLEEIEFYAFFKCNLDTLIIPRNTRLVPSLGQSEWYGVLDACSIKTLVFCGTDGLFLPTTFAHIKFPADGSGRIVFWGNPPEYIEVSNLKFNYQGGEVQSGPFTICYPAQYSSAWAPNGESTWNGIPMRSLTRLEEQELIQIAPQLFSDEDRTDVTEYPGWSFDQNHNVVIYSEEGWQRYCNANWGMAINDLIFEEGVERISEYFNPTSDEGMYPGPSDITMNRLLLPESLKYANLDHMITKDVIVANGNQHFKAVDGKLIEIDSGKVIWPIEASVVSDSMSAKNATENSTSPSASPNEKFLLSAVATVAVAAVAGIIIRLVRKARR